MAERHSVNETSARPAGVIPIVQALLAKGAALGTVLAFMISVIALSLPLVVAKTHMIRLPRTPPGLRHPRVP